MPTVQSNARQADGVTRVDAAELIALRQQLPRRLSTAAMTVSARRTGAHAGAIRGRGMDYRESRAYQPGDDVRRLDWRLTARSGRLHTKVFQEDRERSLIILMDTHTGMHFGTRRRFKSVQAARAGAIATWLGVATGMRVGVAAFGTQRSLIRPRDGVHGALAAIHALCQWQHAPGDPDAGRADTMSSGLRRLAGPVHGGSEVLVISDGGSVDPSTRAELVHLRRHARIGVLVVADALESHLPPAGHYPLAWGNELHRVDLSTQAARRHFRDTLGCGRTTLMQLSSSLALPCVGIGTVETPIRTVAGLLGIRMPGSRT